MGHNRKTGHAKILCCSGFTLVELLVVISIIALLLSILMPSLNKAREQARAVVCRSNLKQEGNALQMYLMDNSNTFPLAVFVPVGQWSNWRGVNPANTRTGDYPLWADALNKYLDNAVSFKCPSVVGKENIDFILPDTSTGGSRFNCHTIHYGYNYGRFGYPWPDKVNPWYTDSNGAKRSGYVKEGKLKNIGNYIIIADSKADGSLQCNIGWGHEIGFRHRGGANIMLGDTHIAWISWGDVDQSRIPQNIWVTKNGYKLYP